MDKEDAKEQGIIGNDRKADVKRIGKKVQISIKNISKERLNISSDELIQQALNYITAWRPDVDTSVGTLVKDIVIDVPATVLGVAYQDLQQIQKASSINYVNELTDNQVEELAGNYNLTRKTGSYATGIITFIRYSAPTTTITVGASDGTGGVHQSSPGTNGLACTAKDAELQLSQTLLVR